MHSFYTLASALVIVAVASFAVRGLKGLDDVAEGN